MLWIPDGDKVATVIGTVHSYRPAVQLKTCTNTFSFIPVGKSIMIRPIKNDSATYRLRHMGKKHWPAARG